MADREEITHRISVGFSDREWAAIEDAMRVRYLLPEEKEIDSITWRERNCFLKHAIWAVCKAIIRRNKRLRPALACDVRDETPAEMAERLGEPLPPASTWTVNTGATAKLTNSQRRMIRQLILNPPEQPLPGTANYGVGIDSFVDSLDKFSNAVPVDANDTAENIQLAWQIYQLEVEGMRSYIVEDPVLRRTTFTSLQYQVALSDINCGKLLSTGALIDLESVPQLLLFNLPNKQPAFINVDAPEKKYAWLKSRPTVTQVALLKWCLVTEFVYGYWPTVVYDQPI